MSCFFNYKLIKYIFLPNKIVSFLAFTSIYSCDIITLKKAHGAEMFV